MRIKSKVWQWLAVACGCVGLLYGLGVEGTLQTTGELNGGGFTTAFVLILLALLFLRLYAAARDREERMTRKAHRKPENTIQSSRRMGA